MTEAKKPELHADVAALSTKITAGITMDSKAGTASANADLYKDNLPADLTMEAVKAVSDYNTTFVAAGAHAFGKLAVDAMKSNKKLDKVAVDIPMGVKDKVSYTVERSKEVSNPFDKDAKPTTKYGDIKTTYEVKAGKNGGQLKTARQLIGEYAAAAIGAK